MVDDEPVIAQLAAAILRRERWDVETAYHPLEALERFGDGTGFDLVVSDFVMPKMNGCELIVEIRRRRPGMPAVFMSGYVGGIPKCECPVVSKPFRPSDLTARVCQVLAEAVPVCTGIRIANNILPAQPA